MSDFLISLLAFKYSYYTFMCVSCFFVVSTYQMIGYNDSSRYMCCLQLFRIEHVRNWYLYEAVKETLLYQNGGEDPERMSLLHGCPEAAVKNIIAGGLNRAFCDPNSTSIYLFNYYFLDYFLERYIL